MRIWHTLAFKAENEMLASIMLISQLPASTIVQPGGILTWTVQQSEQATWSTRPTLDEIAASPAARIAGGARAALRCIANRQGRVTSCEVAVAEPDLREVHASALLLATKFKLDADSTQKVRWSQTPPTILLQIYFADKNGKTPNTCNPSFGCIAEPPSFSAPVAVPSK
jgi:hypothetical protein